MESPEFCNDNPGGEFIKISIKSLKDYNNNKYLIETFERYKLWLE